MLTLSTGSLQHYGIHRIFQFAKLAGYDAIDVEISKMFDSQDGAYLQQIVQETGIPISSIIAPPTVNKKELLLKYIELTKHVNASSLIIYPPKLFDFEYVQWLKNELPGLRKQEKIHIALINAVPSRLFGFLPEHALNSINDLKKFREVCLDTANVFSLKEDLIRVYEKLKTEIVHIFLSNVRAEKDHILPMEGSLPLESLLTKLKKDAYQGPISIRVNGKSLGEGNEEKVVEQLKKIKTFIQQYY